jgi:hypothetical protein
MAQAQAGTLPDAPQPVHAVVETLLATSLPAQDSSSADVHVIQSGSIQSASTAASSAQTANESTQQSAENKLITQTVRLPRAARSPMPPPRGGAYPSTFAPRPPALSPVGALIGFGAGAALGATASGDQTTRGRVAGALIGGSLCALIGGAIGHAFSAVGHNFHDRNDWDDAQERKHRKPVPRPLERDLEASRARAPAASVGSL